MSILRTNFINFHGDLDTFTWEITFPDTSVDASTTWLPVVEFSKVVKYIQGIGTFQHKDIDNFSSNYYDLSYDFQFNTNAPTNNGYNVEMDNNFDNTIAGEYEGSYSIKKYPSSNLPGSEFTGEYKYLEENVPFTFKVNKSYRSFENFADTYGLVDHSNSAALSLNSSDYLASSAALDINNYNPTNMSRMFYNCQNLTVDSYVASLISNFDTSRCTNMAYAFYYCSNLSGIDVSNWNTSNVTDMNYMFYRCAQMSNIDVSDWDTSLVTNMANMFNRCVGITSIDVTGFDTSLVTNMQGMFYECTGLTSLDLSTWDTSNVQLSPSSSTSGGYRSMFKYCSNLEVIDISNFDTRKFTSNSSALDAMMTDMFYGCTKLQYLIINSNPYKFVMKNSTWGGLLNTNCTILTPFPSSYGMNQYAQTWINGSSNISRFQPIDNYTITRSNGQVTVTPNS